MSLNRRYFLAGLLGTAAVPVAGCAEAPATSPRPYPRGSSVPTRSFSPVADVVTRSGLGAEHAAFLAVDARTGELIEGYRADVPMPPASTAKALTSLYALGNLGPAHTFQTSLVATGPVSNGRIEGDLILVGGGDPVLETGALSEMAAALKARGVTEIAGDIRAWTGALPYVEQIDDEQPAHVGYNPTVCGLNLNYNRVHFGWERQGSGYSVTMDARGGGAIPGVTMSRMEVVNRSSPIYTYSRGADRDNWTVASGALGGSGSRWLPVRHPGLYAAEVLHVLARSHGITVGGSSGLADRLTGTPIVTHRSDPVAPILKDMLQYSNNLTAEVVGMGASSVGGRMPNGLPGSAGQMNDWLRRELGLNAPALRDHSGLSDDSRITPDDMVRAMLATGPDGALRPLLKPFNMPQGSPVRVAAKTGTLNFVSALTGFAEAPGGRPIAFAILTGDVGRRDALSMDQRERPQGGRSWNAASKGLQRGLIDRWAAMAVS